MSGITYWRAARVVEAAEQNPKLRFLVDEMNEKGKVFGVYRRLLDLTEARKDPAGPKAGRA